jgi:hypothetical protein
MAVVLALLAGWSQPTRAEALEGYATYMAPGVMDTVISNRGLSWSDGVALNREGDKGRIVWLVWNDGTIAGPLPVVDCAQEGKHFEKRERQHRVVEVSARVAQDKGFYGWGPVPVTVMFAEPGIRWN